MEKVSKIQIGCEKYDIQDKEARQLIEDLQQRDIFEDIRIDATVDQNIGNANVFVNKTEEGYTFNFTGIKGEAGSPGQDGRDGRDGKDGKDGVDGRDGRDGLNGSDGVNGVTPNISVYADVGNTTGVPNVDVSVSGTPENPVFNFHFDGLRGKDGADGKDGTNGTNGRDGVDGRDGRDGKDGTNGTSATIDQLTLNDMKTDIENDLRQTLDITEEKVTELCINGFGTFQEMVHRFPEGGTWSSNDFGKMGLTQWASSMGLVTLENGVYKVGWSELIQSYNSLSGRVDAVEGRLGTGTGEQPDYSLLSAGLWAYITDHSSESGMDATWTKFLVLDSGEILKLKWMSAGVTNYASDAESYSYLMASAKKYGDKELTINDAISKVDALVTKDGNGNYVASTYLASLVDNSVSGLFTRNSSNEAIAGLFADIDGAVDDIDDLDKKINGDGNTPGILVRVKALEDGTNQSSITLTADKINAVTKNAVLNARGLRINGGDWDDPDSREIIVDALSNGTLEVEGKEIKFKNNRDDSSFNVYTSYIQLGGTDANTMSNRIDIGGTNADYPINIKTGNNINISAATLALSGAVTTSSNLTVSGNIYTSGNITFPDSNNHEITVAGGRLTLSAPNIYFSGANITASSPIVTSSDERYKNIIDDVTLSVEQIASTRAVDYSFKSDESEIYSGTIAQDWQSILPNAVKASEDDNRLGLNYSSAALVSAIIDAREIVKLKQENEELKQRLAAIEERLANL